MEEQVHSTPLGKGNRMNKAINDDKLKVSMNQVDFDTKKQNFNKSMKAKGDNHLVGLKFEEYNEEAYNQENKFVHGLTNYEALKRKQKIYTFTVHDYYQNFRNAPYTLYKSEKELLTFYKAVEKILKQLLKQKQTTMENDNKNKALDIINNKQFYT